MSKKEVKRNLLLQFLESAQNKSGKKITIPAGYLKASRKRFGKSKLIIEIE